MAAYGNDEITQRVKARFAEIFEREVAVFFVTTGTAANALALSAAVPPWGLVRLPPGSPRHRRRMRRAGILHAWGQARRPARHRRQADAPRTSTPICDSLPKAVKQMPPKALSISQVTECGMVYGLDEIGALGAVCREHGLAFHMDGARFANALVVARLHARPR